MRAPVPVPVPVPVQVPVQVLVQVQVQVRVRVRARARAKPVRVPASSSSVARSRKPPRRRKSPLSNRVWMMRWAYSRRPDSAARAVAASTFTSCPGTSSLARPAQAKPLR